MDPIGQNSECFAASVSPRIFLFFGSAFVFVPAGLNSNSALSVVIAAVASSRSATDVMPGAHPFLQTYPANLLKLKTSERFLELSRRKNQWFKSADIDFSTVEFGAAGENILAAFKTGWLQNIAIGGGKGRAEVSAAPARLGASLFKRFVLSDGTEQMWRLSKDGVVWDRVRHRVAMSEMQEIADPTALYVGAVPSNDELTGIRETRQKNLEDKAQRFVHRINKWLALQRKSNSDNMIALTCCNGLPGRHEVGADYLKVPSKVFDLLHTLKSEGCELGSPPESEAELLVFLQERAVNLPDRGEALAAMSHRPSMSFLNNTKSAMKRCPRNADPVLRCKFGTGLLQTGIVCLS